jgi:hypothetical protein
MMTALLLLFKVLLRFFLPRNGNDRKAFISMCLYFGLIRVIVGFLARKGTISIRAILIGVRIFFFFVARSFLLKSIRFIMSVLLLRIISYSGYLHKH